MVMKGAKSSMGRLGKFGNPFKKPEGFLGSIAGKLMATVGAEKNKWTLFLLNVNNGDNVLEIGFGPGRCSCKL